MNDFGILILDKPSGKSSTLIGSVCKRILKVKKLGHIGTLDPFATGVLPIAVGGATKIIPYINVDKKTYEFEIKFGQKTSTGDICGEVVESSCHIPTAEEICAVLPKFFGNILQTPHAFSAIKVGGKRAYDIARAGGVPNLVPRQVNIFDLQLLQKTHDDVFQFCATVSAGTYIRSLSEDIAEAMGALGHTVSLRRVQNGKFFIKNAISVDELREKCDNGEDILLPLEDVLDDILVIFISANDIKFFTDGRGVSVDGLYEENSLHIVRSDEKFCAIAMHSNGFLWPKRIIHF